jgi:hypothetical protein
MTSTSTTTTPLLKSHVPNISGNIALNITSSTPAASKRSRYHVPWPETKEAERRWQLEQMAGAFRFFAKLGYADGASGHISYRGQQFCL